MTGSERWAALEIRLLLALVAVVDEGSFTRAAHQLGYTQSGISQQIATLERIVDRKLLVRQAGGRRPIELTPSGEALLHHSRALLGRLDRAYREVVERERSRAATVRLAAFSSAAVHVVPALQRALRAHHPSLALELLDAVKEEDVVARLDAGEAELGIAVLPVPPRFVVHELGSDPYVAVVPATSRFASRSKISLAQLTDQPLLGVRGSHEAVVAARLAAAGIDCHAVTRYDDSRLIQAHVAAGNGIAIVPSTTVEAADPSIRVLGIHGNLPPRMLALVQLRDTLPAASAREFQQIALPLCRKLLVEVGACWADANAS